MSHHFNINEEKCQIPTFKEYTVLIIKTMVLCLMKLLEMDDSAFIGAPPPSKQRERLEGKISCLGVTMVTLFRVRVMTPCTENG